MLALVGVAIATTFTSCEKEDFNVNIDPINAQATIEATVLYVDETGTTNVTYNGATFTFSAGVQAGNTATFTGNPTLSAQPVTVTATYQGLSGTATVNVPALGAGQFLSMSTTIILQEAAPAPVNAKAEVKPVVFLSADGVLTDITAEAEITFEPDNGGVFEGTPILEATTSKITATYGELSNTVEVEIPRLIAGQYATLAPTIILTQMAEEANAIAEIKPIVLHMTSSAVVDVTADADITYVPDNDGKFEGTPNLEGTTSTITATYEGLTSTVTVNVPALEAGEYTTLTPTIILMDAMEIPVVTIEYEADPVETEESTDKFVEDNVSDYWYYTTVKYTEKLGEQVQSSEITTQDMTELAVINSFVKELNTYKETEMLKEEVPVYSHSRTEASVTYSVVATTYSIYRVTKMVPLTKADDNDGKELIATVKTKNYTATKLITTPGLQIPGHGHAPMGHGHGFDHGHGNGNAGGGIVVSD